MMKFKSKRIVPPGGQYFYQTPETGVAFASPTFTGLLSQLYEHYKSNNIPTPVNLPELAEHYMCARLPEAFCVGEGERTARATTLRDITKATEQLVSGGLVAEDVARMRLDVCLKCALNDRQLCSSCTGLMHWAKRLVRRSLPRDEWLGVCSADITALPARIHLRNTPEGVEYPEHCWAYKHE
jgi:hypothetical protein